MLTCFSKSFVFVVLFAAVETLKVFNKVPLDPQLNMRSLDLSGVQTMDLGG